MKPIFCPFPDGSVVNNLPANAGEMGLIPQLEGSPGAGNGNPLQFLAGKSHGKRRLVGYKVHRVAKSQTPLSD